MSQTKTRSSSQGTPSNASIFGKEANNQKKQTSTNNLVKNISITSPTPVEHACGKCDRGCPDGSEAIQCDLCNVWFHRVCTPLTPSEYQALSRGNECLMFACPICRDHHGKENRLRSEKTNLIKESQRVEARVDGRSGRGHQEE